MADSIRISVLCGGTKIRKKSSILKMSRTLILHKNNAEKLFKKIKKPLLLFEINSLLFLIHVDFFKFSYILNFFQTGIKVTSFE